MLEGFSFINNEEKICEFKPLSSDLIRKSESDIDTFSIGMAYSHMDVINTALIAAYDVGGDNYYNKIFKIYKPYVDAVAQTELELMKILPSKQNKSAKKVSISNYEQLTSFLSNPNWVDILSSIKNSIKKIAVKISDDIPLIEANLLREIHKTSSTLIVDGVAWHERPIATLALTAKFLESFPFTKTLTLQEFHKILFEGITFTINQLAQSEKRKVLFNDIAHDDLLAVLRCVKLAKDNPLEFYFSAIRYSSTASLVRDLAFQNSTISCPFTMLCSNTILRNQIRMMCSESCILRNVLANSLKLVESKISSDQECCIDGLNERFIKKLSDSIPNHIENLLKMIKQIITRKNDCNLCNTLRNTMIEQNYTEKNILELTKDLKKNMKNQLNDILFPPQSYIQSSMLV